jgi:hypothetical protein
MRLYAVAVGMLLMGACAACGGARRAGASELRSFYYTDNSGLSVSTTGLTADQQVSRRVTLRMRAVADYVALERKPLDPGDPLAMSQPSGHHPHPDVVSSASSTAAGGAVKEKWRFEGNAAVARAGTIRGEPGVLEARVRASHETDYMSISGGVSGQIETRERNTTLAGFIGAGHDAVDPVEKPPGQLDDWPATHDRVTAGGSISQVVSPRVVVGAGAGATWQWGMLANPYRRALVVTSLFPEEVPDSRGRFTAFAAAAWYLGAGAALHLRQGAYLDTWEVFALVPEAAVVVERGPWLTTIRYQYYTQWSADFYRARYERIEPLISGDSRLGRIEQHAAGLELRRALGGAFSFVASYDFSLLWYRSLGTDVILGHSFSLGAAATY